MDDATVQRKLNQLTKISNELAEEASRRYGPDGCLFYESGGTFNFMSKDNIRGEELRDEGVELSSNGVCLLECGSW